MQENNWNESSLKDNSSSYTEGIDIDSTLDQISKELKSDETLILEVGNNNLQQTDIIYDTLVMKGYNVMKYFKEGKCHIIVSKSKKN